MRQKYVQTLSKQQNLCGWQTVLARQDTRVSNIGLCPHIKYPRALPGDIYCSLSKNKTHGAISVEWASSVCFSVLGSVDFPSYGFLFWSESAAPGHPGQPAWDAASHRHSMERAGGYVTRRAPAAGSIRAETPGKLWRAFSTRFLPWTQIIVSPI